MYAGSALQFQTWKPSKENPRMIIVNAKAFQRKLIWYLYSQRSKASDYLYLCDTLDRKYQQEISCVQPDKTRRSPRLLFTALCAAGALCVFVQNHFLSSYLPVLTGDPIDWSQYRGWNVLSIALWGGVFAGFAALVFLRPRIARILGYTALAVILCAESVTLTVEAATSDYSEQPEPYFSETGLYETSAAGNVVLLISDTFEATYMDMLLEEYPEYRDLLSDVTYYDNVTGTSIFTYFSYAKIMTGVDFPIGKYAWNGVLWCFDNQTTVDRVRENGWDVSYYTTFTPSESMKGKILNYSDELNHPNAAGAWALTKLLFRNSLFRSAPQPLKMRFITFQQEYELLKTTQANADYYTESDRKVYAHLRDEGLTAVDGNPRYTLVQLWGIHEPSHITADFEEMEYTDDVPVDERKVQAVRAQLSMLRTYLDQLKAAGTYDDTTVILTADHGFNMRLYPVFLVKEAHRTEEGFRTDHTPLSMQDDYEDLLCALTSGQSFSEAVRGYTDEDRVRHALDFRSSEGYKSETTQRSLVEIRGDAADPASYQYMEEAFLLDDGFLGRCELNTPFIVGGKSNQTVAVYGLEPRYGNIYGHCAVFDAFFRTDGTRRLTLKLTLKNGTAKAQRLVFTVNGEKLEGTWAAEPYPAVTEIEVPLPETDGKRITVEMFLPDAVLEKNPVEALGWNEFCSCTVVTAALSE